MRGNYLVGMSRSYGWSEKKAGRVHGAYKANSKHEDVISVTIVDNEILPMLSTHFLTCSKYFAK
jgi:hypothetical protein